MNPEPVSRIVPRVMSEIVRRRDVRIKPCIGNHDVYNDGLCAQCPCNGDCEEFTRNGGETLFDNTESSDDPGEAPF